MDYIIHGTLYDYIDYARLIEYQANEVFRAMPLKVVDTRPSNKKSQRYFSRNASVNTNRCYTLTNRRKVLSKKVPRGKVTK
ncbi:MAG: hypothetical protein K2G03_00165 [Bacilli bacterium]|nr:hypothetical protein [Bacilli bacterium]MDE6140993.1 hypothetical protein [Bacilli bacterium]